MMAFKKNFVVSIKCDGKILREEDGTVTLPFGKEYSLLIKNINTRKALVNIDIDGTRIFNGLLLPANKTVELERFQNKDQKFKFIEKTQRISDHRGDFIDDGFVRVEFTYEKELPMTSDKWVRTRYIPYDYTYYNHQPIHWDGRSPMHFASGDVVTFSVGAGGPTCGGASGASGASGPASAYGTTSTITRSMVAQSDSGITVGGEESGQRFTNGFIGTLEANSEVIVLRLRGSVGSVQVKEPVTVKTKIVCPTCGRNCKHNNKFCPNCGTNLTVN